MNSDCNICDGNGKPGTAGYTVLLDVVLQSRLLRKTQGSSAHGKKYYEV